MLTKETIVTSSFQGSKVLLTKTGVGKVSLYYTSFQGYCFSLLHFFTPTMNQRRSLNTSDESTESIASSIVRNPQIAQRFIDATELEMMPDSTILERSFNLKLVISTTSSFSRRVQEARSRPDLQDIHQIGMGLQGVVFE